MDDLTAVRDLEVDVPALADAARSAARVRLRCAIVRERRPGALPRRLLLRVAVAGTATTAVAGGAVVAARHDRGADTSLKGGKTRT